MLISGGVDKSLCFWKVNWKKDAIELLLLLQEILPVFPMMTIAEIIMLVFGIYLKKYLNTEEIDEYKIKQIGRQVAQVSYSQTI